MGDGVRLDGESLHAALAVFAVHHHHHRLGGGFGVEVVAERPDDVAAGAGVDEGVLFVRVVAGFGGVVLVVDFGRRLAAGREHELEVAGRARGGDGAVAAGEDVAVFVGGGPDGRAASSG